MAMGTPQHLEVGRVVAQMERLVANQLWVVVAVEVREAVAVEWGVHRFMAVAVAEVAVRTEREAVPGERQLLAVTVAVVPMMQTTQPRGHNRVAVVEGANLVRLERAETGM
jgi:hypothetical protein